MILILCEHSRAFR